MSESYFTEEDKLVRVSFPKWTNKETSEMSHIMYTKDYEVNCVQRIGCDGKLHDAWLVPRADIPMIIEQLFRKRIVVEVQAEGHYRASVNFVYDYPASQILEVCRRFHRNKKEVKE